MEPKPSPDPVSEAFTDLDARLDALGGNLQLLGKRLRPVLTPRPEAANGSDGSAVAAVRAPVVEALAQFSARVQALYDLVNGLHRDLAI